MQDGTAAPPLTIAQPVRDEDRPASRHLIIGRCGVGAAIASAVVCLLAFGSVLDGDGPVADDAWAWGRSLLITAILAGLVLAGYGYGVEAANRREERANDARTKAAVEAAVKAAAFTAEVIAAVEASRVHMHDDHAALHGDSVQLRQRLDEVAVQVTDMRADLKEALALLAVMRQESPPAELFVARMGEIHERQDEAEKVLAEVAAKVSVAYTTGFTDGIGGPAE